MTNFCLQKRANKCRSFRGAPPIPHASAPSTSTYHTSATPTTAPTSAHHMTAPASAPPTNPLPIWRIERRPIAPVSTPPFQPDSPPPITYEVLPFTSTRPATVAPAKVNGPANHPYTQATLTKLLQIAPRDLQALLKVIEVIFVLDANPVSSREFRWFPDAPDAILQSLNALPFPVDLVARVLANNSMCSDARTVEELGFYMYHVALAAKKRVGRKKSATKVRQRADQIVCSLGLVASRDTNWCRRRLRNPSRSLSMRGR